MSVQPSLADQFKRFADDFGNNIAAGELEAALLVNRALAPNLDLTAVNAGISSLVGGCDRSTEPWSYLKTLGFRGNAGNDSALDNSRLDLVLEARRGIPISLGVLLIHLARSLGHTAAGVNFPGHFLVRIDQHLIDPFVMNPTSEAECRSRLAAPERGNLFPLASAKAVALRMLNNLKFHYAGMTRWDLALDILDYQLVLEPGDAGMLYEQGEFWLQLGAVEAARAAFEQCAVQAGEEYGDLLSVVEGQLRSLASHQDTLH